jgi:hypothetical protein
LATRRLTALANPAQLKKHKKRSVESAKATLAQVIAGDAVHGVAITLIDSRSAIARYPSGTSSRPTVRSNTLPGWMRPSRMSGSSSSM